MDMTLTLVLVNLVLQVIQTFDKFISRINKSSCCGGILELSPTSPQRQISNSNNNELALNTKTGKSIHIDIIKEEEGMQV
jgi:hypothetical protein